MRIALSEVATLNKTFDVEGVAVDNGTVTVTVKNLDNVTVSTGTATKTAVGTDPTNYTYSYVLPAQSTLGQLKVTWAGTKTETYYVEVVGFHLCELSDIRTRWSQIPTAKPITDTRLRAARDVATDRLDAICGTAFAPRRVVELVAATGTAGLVGTYGLVQVVTVNGDAFTGTATRDGFLLGLPAGQTATVVYEAQEFAGGLVPEDLKRAVVELSLALLGQTTSSIPDNVETMQTDEATFRMVVPGQRGSDTGIPRVDAVIKDYKRLTSGNGGIY